MNTTDAAFLAAAQNTTNIVEQIIYQKIPATTTTTTTIINQKEYRFETTKDFLLGTTTTTTMPTTEIRSCAEWNHLFANLNNYFRNEEILKGSEHSSLELGYLITCAYLIVILFGAIGNFLTIIAVLRNSQMRTVRNFFILNLALSDFFICTVTAPITLYTVLYVFWPFGTTLCKVVGSLQGFNIFLSTFSIAAIALDRYVLVIFPTKRERQHNLSLLFFLLIWLISILLALPLFAASDLGLIFEEKNCGIILTICHEQNVRWQQMPINKEVYTVGVLVIQYAFPLCSIVFAYSRIASRMSNRFTSQYSNKLTTTTKSTNIIRNIKRTTTINEASSYNALPQQQKTITQSAPTTTTTISRNSLPNYIINNNNNNNANNNYEQLIQIAQEVRQKSIADRYRRTNFLLFSIVIVFAVAWFPLNIFHLLNTFNLTSNFSVSTFALCHVIAICSACLNPVSYAFFNQNFRSEFVAIFQSVGLRWIYLRINDFKKSLKFSRQKNCCNDGNTIDGRKCDARRRRKKWKRRESTIQSKNSIF